MPVEQNIFLAVDAIVFGYSKENAVSVLLIQRKFGAQKGKWAIPGGFVKSAETLEEAVERELNEETGITINYLEQLYTFGKPDRDPRRRVVSVAYFGLVKTSKFLKLKASSDASKADWFPINELPDLAFDHNQILTVAIERLRAKIMYQPIGFELLDRKFPFSDLEKLYTALLGREIDRRNFKKKVMSLGILEQLDEKVNAPGSGRPASLFRFNKRTYNQLVKKGVHFEI